LRKLNVESIVVNKRNVRQPFKPQLKWPIRELI